MRARLSKQQLLCSRRAQDEVAGSDIVRFYGGYKYNYSSEADPYTLFIVFTRVFDYMVPLEF